MFCLADKSCCHVNHPSSDLVCAATSRPQHPPMEHPYSIEHPTSKHSLWYIYASYENVNSTDSRKVDFREPFMYVMSIPGDDCDEKTIGLEVIDVN